ncbi:MAG: hypothetical protein HQL15_10560 [Candidatus Omnitrophica bacterium]|nr:hypothetical protein [Candidatus Omnitrophota bacterium]
MASGIKAIKNQSDLVGQALSKEGVLNAGKRISDAEIKGGIRQTAPTLRTIAEDLGLPKGERSLGDVLNTMKGRIDANQIPDKQTLAEFHDLVSDAIKKGTILPNSNTGFIASDLKTKVGELLNKLAPGREEAIANYGSVKDMVKAMDKAKNISKKLAIAAALGAAGYGGFKHLGKIIP